MSRLPGFSRISTDSITGDADSESGDQLEKIYRVIFIAGIILGLLLLVSLFAPMFEINGVEYSPHELLEKANANPKVTTLGPAVALLGGLFVLIGSVFGYERISKKYLISILAGWFIYRYFLEVARVEETLPSWESGTTSTGALIFGLTRMAAIIGPVLGVVVALMLKYSE